MDTCLHSIYGWVIYHIMFQIKILFWYLTCVWFIFQVNISENASDLIIQMEPRVIFLFSILNSKACKKRNRITCSINKLKLFFKYSIITYNNNIYNFKHRKMILPYPVNKIYIIDDIMLLLAISSSSYYYCKN